MGITFNTDTYVASLRRRIEAMRRTTHQVVAKAAAEAHANIVQRTPVDTGRARASWQLQPENAFTWKIVSEGVSYIGILEFGAYRGVGPKTVQTGEGIFSRQAPHGMVRISLTELKEKYARDLGLALQTSWSTH